MRNILEWVDNGLINSNVTMSDRFKEKLNPHTYFREWEKRCTKWVQTTDFSLELHNHRNEILNMQTSKTELEAYLSKYKVDVYFYYLKIFAKILSDFERNGDLESEIAQKFLTWYNYLKMLLKQRFPDLARQAEAEIFERTKNKRQAQYITCIECGSQNVRSYGDRWKCNACGRTFLKKPRFKHYKK